MYCGMKTHAVCEELIKLFVGRRRAAMLENAVVSEEIAVRDELAVHMSSDGLDRLRQQM